MLDFRVVLTFFSTLTLCVTLAGGYSFDDTPAVENRTDVLPSSELTHAVSQEAPADTSDALYIERIALRDPAVNNLESHTLLAPRGWTVHGGPVWTPQAFRSFVHLNLRLRAPDGREVAVYPGMMYSYVRADAMPPFPTGSIDNGTILMPVPSSIEEYVAGLFMPQHHPQAQNVRVLESTERPEMHRALEEMARPVVEAERQRDAMMGTQTEFTTIAVCVRVSYEENGHVWEEDLYFDGQTQQTFSYEMNLGQVVQSIWWLSDVTGVRAPAGSLEQAKPLLDAIRLSIRRTPEYAALIYEINARILREDARALKEAAQIWIQHQNEILRTQGPKVASTQAAIDKAHREFVNYIRDVDDYKTPDGSTIALPAHYDHVYTNGQGNYVLTNDAFFIAAGWTQVERAR